MAFFNKNKKNEVKENAEIKQNDALKDDISKAYDEIMAGGVGDAEAAEQLKQSEPQTGQPGFESEILKMKIREFKEKKTQESLTEVIKLLPKRIFLLPSVCNMKEPFENTDGELRLKKGAEISPALLNGQDNKVFLPVFTDEASMTQKSPSGVVLKLSMEQCVSVVYDKKNPVWAIVINPFTENMIIGEDLLRHVFIEKKQDA